MLIRTTTDSSFECILQEHHAVLSGVLAAAWDETRLDPLLIQAIGLHDNPWRTADQTPRFDAERGLPHDFVTYPMDEKIAFYRRGIDELEGVHPWIAYLVSRHYTTFSGTRDVDTLQAPERERRERLESRLPVRLLDDSDAALAWMKFFDVLSLHLCLTGPHADPDSIPRWLSDPSAWSTAPDDTALELRWRDDQTLRVDPWPFARAELVVDITYRLLDARADDADTLAHRWDEAPLESRQVTLDAGPGSNHDSTLGA